ncbi:MAG: selenocysteine-specific translation elongation factor, partial [Solirubrobacterales bacterium]
QPRQQRRKRWPEMAPLPLTIGTAGHIDHGKTALVRALTGRNTDRLPEERQRGMSIELGFADLDLGERCLSLIDVPGHERFVRTMIAGASGIDMFLLVVAADDGPMPQTLEHLAVLRALAVEQGVVALTRIDLADAAMRRAAAEECARLAPGLPLLEVSPQTGEGIEGLRATLAQVASEIETDKSSPHTGGNLRHSFGTPPEEPVLHVDRVFTIAGHGTVVTGTLWSGQLERGQRVTILPEEHEGRIRSIEVHDRPCDTAESHQRVALNLSGIDRDEVARGDVITAEGAGVHVTYRLDVELRTGAETILTEPRVQVHLGTRDSPARVVALGGNSAQLRLERPLLARSGDRVVVRRIAPPDTLGGGVVREPAPPRHGPGWERRPTEEEPIPARPPSPLEPSPFARRVLTALEKDADHPRGAAHLAEDLGSDRRSVERAFSELGAVGAAVRAKVDVVYAASAYEKLAQLIVALAKRDGSTSIGEVRDALGLSRKYAQALLEQLNSEHRLRRDGDRHFPRPTPTASD